MKEGEPPKEKNVEIFVSPVFIEDMRKAGWVLLADTPVKKHERIFFPSVKKKGKYIETTWGQRQGEAALLHQAFIPEIVRIYPLLLTGTVWENEQGLQVFPYIRWSSLKNKWILDFTWQAYHDKY